ncbi:MAG: acetyl-CoA carboxylase carboxyltransferase subunit beta [Rhodospirillales bacterium]|nr:acetyl-CoA carboxylase carboxyltransferase subunit beta [Rhodospirillales bacterium]
MSWLTNFIRPRIRAVFKKRSQGEDSYLKCPKCEQDIFRQDYVKALQVCSHCDHHGRVGPKDRFDALFDEGSYTEIELPQVPLDPLKFRDTKKYADRLKEARAKSQKDDAMAVAHGSLGGINTVVAVQDFGFMGGSMGLAIGTAIVTAAETAIAEKAPLVLFAAAGGARMQEGILSLMQMPKTTVAVDMVREAGLPYIVVLTDPTTGGVTASYAMLGDLNIAEPGALIGFAGPRVIQNTIGEQLPEGFQRAEYLRDHGMVDMVVHRHDMKATLARTLSLLLNRDPLPITLSLPSGIVDTPPLPDQPIAR